MGLRVHENVKTDSHNFAFTFYLPLLQGDWSYLFNGWWTKQESCFQMMRSDYYLDKCCRGNECCRGNKCCRGNECCRGEAKPNIENGNQLVTETCVDVAAEKVSLQETQDA